MQELYGCDCKTLFKDREDTLIKWRYIMLMNGKLTIINISLPQMNTRCSFGQMTLKFIWKSKGKNNQNNF